MNGEAHGLEVFADWKVSNRWTLSPGYGFEQVHMHLDPGSQDTSSVGDAQGSARSIPRNSFHLTLPIAFPGTPRHTSSARSPTQRVLLYTTGHRLVWQAQERLSFSVVGQNLLKDRHLEYLDSGRSVASTLVKRSIYAKVTWTF